MSNTLCWIASGLGLPQMGDGSFCNNDPSPNQPPLPLTGERLEELFKKITIDEPFRPYVSPAVFRPPVSAPVEIPERKLPQEADGQTDYDTPDGRSISLQESLKNRKYGKLLWNPLSDSKIEVNVPKLDYLEKKINEYRKEGQTRFDAFVTDTLEKDKDGNEKKPLTMWEKTALAFTDTPSGLGGELNLMFGLNWFRELINANKQSSKTALMKVHDFIPFQVKVNSQNISFTQTFSDENVDISGLGEIGKVLGIDAFPGEVPKSLLASSGMGDSALESIWGVVVDSADAVSKLNKGVEIKNYAELFMWYINQFDALIGQFPVEIEIEDTDVMKEGDQTKIIKIANIAEGIREIYGANVIESLMIDGNFNILMRLIPEITRIRQECIITGDVLQACREFLGFKHKEVEATINNNFNITADLAKITDLYKFLEPNESKYKTIEFDGKESVLDYLLRLMYSASLSKASILKDFQSVKDFFDKEAERQENLDKEQEEDWKQFKDEINNPESAFNLNEKPSKIRDSGGEE